MELPRWQVKAETLSTWRSCSGFPFLGPHPPLGPQQGSQKRRKLSCREREEAPLGGRLGIFT